MAKTVVLQGWFGMDNFGDDLLLKVTLSHLLKSDADIRIRVIGEGAEKPSFLPIDVSYVPRSSRKWSWLRKRWLKSGCDWVLCGGSILADEVLSRFIEPAKLVKAHGGRVWMHAIGLRGELSHSQDLQTLMSLTDGCSVREVFGQQQLSRYMPVELVADPVFALGGDAAPTHQRLLIALRGADTSTTHIQVLAEHVLQTGSSYEGVDILVSFTQQDLQASESLLHALKTIPVRLLHQQSLQTKIDAIRQAKHVISMRLHPAIVALAAGNVPWVLSPEHKQRALMQDMDLQDYLCDWHDVDKVFMSQQPRHVDAQALQAQGMKALTLLTHWISHD